jgi:hypothetical protein
MNPTMTPPAPPTAVVAEQSVPEVLKQAYAIQPGTKKEIVALLGDGLCAKVALETGPATPEALQRELPDDRFISDVFPPIRLIFPDGTKEPEPKGRYEIARVLKVQPLTGEHVLKAFAKDVPFDPDAKSAAAVDNTPLVDSQLLFDQRRVKEWSK